MLDATNANNFQAYLQSTEQLESNDVDQPLMEMPVSPRMPKREPEFVDLEALQRQDQSDEEIHSDLGLESDAKEDNSLYQDEEVWFPLILQECIHLYRHILYGVIKFLVQCMKFPVSLYKINKFI